MSISTTEYVVRTKYETTGDTGKLDAIAKAAQRAGDSMSDLKGIALGLGAVIGAGEMFRLGKEHLIEFNSNLEQARITMAGVIASAKNDDVSKHFADANKMVAELQQRAKATTSTTMELVDIAQYLAGPITNAGGSMRDLQNFTVGVSVAARAMHRDSSYAIIEVQEALAGNWTKRMMFLNQILGPVAGRMGLDQKKFNALSESKRYEILRQALDSPQLRQMAEMQRNSFAGVTSTLRDNIEIALGKIGLPLFQKITEEIGRWNKWFDDHPKQLQAIIDKVANALVTGFNAMKTAMTFVWDHRGVIEDLIKLAVISKAGGFVGSMLGGLAGKFGPGGETPLLLTGMKDLATVTVEGKKVSSAFVGIQRAAGPLIATLAGSIYLGTAIREHLEKQYAQTKNRVNNQGILAGVAADGVSGASNQLAILRNARAAGFIMNDPLTQRGGAHSLIDMSKLGQSLSLAAIQDPEFRAMSEQRRQEVLAMRILAAEQNLATYALNENTLVAKDLSSSVRGWTAVAGVIAATTKVQGILDEAVRKKASKPAGTNITIQQVLVPATDPDRWMQSLENEARRRARAPRRPRASLRGGGV